MAFVPEGAIFLMPPGTSCLPEVRDISTLAGVAAAEASRRDDRNINS